MLMRSASEISQVQAPGPDNRRSTASRARKISGKSDSRGEANELLWMERVGIAIVHDFDPQATAIELVTDRIRTA